MDHLERVKRCIAGERLDRPPFSMWMHFHLKDRNPVALADASLHLRDEYEMDFLKITPSGLYLCRILAQPSNSAKKSGNTLLC